MSKLKKMILRFFVLPLSSIVLLSSSIVLHPSSIVYAAVPHLINYQGRLTDSGGTPLNGSYSLTFRIYDAEAAGNLLWQETHSGVLIQKGIFSILLGSVTNLDLPFDKAYFLEIKVGSEVMSPRQTITSSGYAIRAENAETANTLNISAQQGDILYFNGSNWVKLGAGAAEQFLKTQGTGANPIWDFPSGIPRNIQVFTSSGTWTKPTGVNKVWVKVWGAGGGGESGGRGGGGGGGYSEGLVGVSSDITVTVGTGGSGGRDFENSSNSGGASSFAGSYTLTANGGYRGGGSGGSGGSASGGAINISGGSGGCGNLQENAGVGGAGGGSPFGGAGGAGGQNIIAPGVVGTNPGGGGGGGGRVGISAGAGGAGAPGLVIVYW